MFHDSQYLNILLIIVLLYYARTTYQPIVGVYTS